MRNIANPSKKADLAPASKKVCGVKLNLTDEMREKIVNLHFMTEGQSPIF